MERYNITINRHDIYKGQSSYQAGELAEVSIMVPTDVNMHVSSQQVQLGRPDYQSGEMIYHFIMPECDVDIQVEMHSSMMNTMYVDDEKQNEVPPLAMMGMNMMMSSMFCSECGFPLKEEDNYCGGCGRKLK